MSSLWFVENEAVLRISVFATLFFAVSLAEALSPAKDLSLPRLRRWPGNLSLTILSTLCLRLVSTSGVVGFAIFVEQQGWGLLNWLAIDSLAPLKLVIAVTALDFFIYWQHVVSHKVRLFWKFHRVHHADPGFDVTTGGRFHPIEILASLGYKLLLVAALGASPLATLLFELILSSMALFNHGNFRLPRTLEILLRKIIVTPDMHRVHHSVILREHHSNFGFNLSIWDRIFRTYLEGPSKGQENLKIGLSEYPENEQPHHIITMLKMPFQSKK